MHDEERKNKNEKEKQLEEHTSGPGEFLTTNTGLKISDTDNSLTAGERGPTLMEDFHFREKMMHFDHERIPERIVHARGTGVHGHFKVYDDSLKEFTKAKFLTDPARETPVFVRFSTVVGFRGSADTVRDVRGFATKFYTQEGNYDLVGNNMPVFFIQDGIKFPDLVHSIKPEPHNEMPQASAAHDNFWDFISLTPESMHMIMWVLSDRALPRSYAMMEGFGVHTFRFINEEGKSHFVKFHWKPKLGIHSLVWDETQKIAGKDPDFNRRDLYEAMEEGNEVEFELGVQLLPEEDEFKFDFDVLDATKLWPEEDVPVKIVGKMTLNGHPDNFHAEVEQAAFHPGHLVPGIDFTNDPLLQARLFSYLDTQLIRLGGPNFNEIPINRPVCPVHNNQRDGHMRQTINKGRTNYSPNSLAKGCPMTSGADMGAFVHYMEKVEGHKIRKRSDSFKDHFTQAALFYNSMTDIEKKHIADAFAFELGKVETMHIRERMVEHINRVNHDLAVQVAGKIGVDTPMEDLSVKNPKTSPALSQEINKVETMAMRKVAILAADGVNADEISKLKEHLKAGKAKGMVVSTKLGKLKAAKGEDVKADHTFSTTASVLFDAVYVPGGAGSFAELKENGDALHFINEQFRHCKPIGATGDGVQLLEASQLKGVDFSSQQAGRATSSKGVVTSGSAEMTDFVAQFTDALKKHRHWDREKKDMVPA